MATLSFSDLRERAYPALWDLGEMKKVQLADGSTFDSIVADVRLALSAVTAEMLSMPHYSGLFSVQDDVEVEYPVGVTNGVQRATEYGRPDPKRGKVTGHSVPVYPWDRALGWTQMGLRKARRATLDADVRSVITDIRSHWQQQLLTRFFKPSAVVVGATAGASVPFADGGTADANYVPLPNPEGKTFLSTHDHFLRLDTHANGLASAIATLQEHGHEQPFELIGSLADIATWTAVTGWASPDWGELIAGGGSTADRARMSDIASYYGYIKTNYGITRVWLSPRVPTAYFGMYKDYGAGDSRNPLRVRIDPIVGFGWDIVPGTYVNDPTMMAVMYSEYGMGVGEDRTNGVAVEIDAADDYAEPTIS